MAVESVAACAPHPAEVLMHQAKKKAAAAAIVDNTTASAQPSSLRPAGTASPAASEAAFHSIWSGFYKKALKERQNQLRLVFPALFPSTVAISSSPSPASTPTLSTTSSSSEVRASSPSSDSESSDESAAERKAPGREPAALFPLNGLDENVADNMVENCVGTLGLPVGIGLNFTINSIPTVVPMCVEEPSVVAAASGAAKTISTFGGGFTASTSERNIIHAQIQVLGIEESEFASAVEQIESRKEEIVALGNQFCDNMRARGGGVMDITVRKVTKRESASKRPNEVRRERSYRSWLVVHLHVDVCDAMGANCASAVAEGTAPLIASLTGGNIGLKIVTNLSVERMAKASFRVPVDKLGYKGIAGEEVAFRLVEANDWARSDPYRATTHNKGIMNGIDAVALATGQDWRAIEAAGHAWNAVRSESYRPFTDYWVEADSEGRRFLNGELELPMPVATKGGVLKTNPVYSYTLGLLNNPDSKRLGMIHVAVGLAQNFAALRALCTEGIQRGHMSLHARNIAIAAGAPSHAIAECVTFMVETGRFNRNAVQEYLTAHEVHHEIRLNASFDNLPAAFKADQKAPEEAAPSLFYFEAADGSQLAGAEGRVTLNVAFQTLGPKPVHIELVPNVPSTKIVRQLFGEKGHAWLSELFDVLESLKLSTHRSERSNAVLAKKLKLLSVLLNLVIRRLMVAYPVETARFVRRITRTRSSSSLEDLVSADDDASSGSEGLSFKKPVGSGIFQHRVLLDVDLKHMSPAADMDSPLRIGFPLVLALWQVFEFRVQQWVGKPVLARALIDEQWRVVSALVDIPLGTSPAPAHSPHSHHHRDGTSHSHHSRSHSHSQRRHSRSGTGGLGLPPIENFRRAMATHAKRFQSTMFVLCDAITFPEGDVTASFVSLLAGIGNALEWNHAIAHDLSASRLARAVRDVAVSRVTKCSTDAGLASGTVNAFFLYLALVHGATDVVEFLRSKVDVSDRAADPAGTHTLEEDERWVRESFQPEIDEFLSCVLGRTQDTTTTATPLIPRAPSAASSSVLDGARVADALRLFGRYYHAEAVLGA
ncbi:hypothetical protein HDU86_008235 [Geranomyces michiganensis]|nr:hypothetical protein HDU86_008235 [Geranomyces michiganensis]